MKTLYSIEQKSPMQKVREAKQKLDKVLNMSDVWDMFLTELNKRKNNELDFFDRVDRETKYWKDKEAIEDHDCHKTEYGEDGCAYH